MYVIHTPLLELKSDYSKVVGYKINIQKSITFLYTSNEKVKFEITNTIPFTLALPQMKYLHINLTKYVQDLYEENCKTLMNKIREELNEWRDILCPSTGCLNIVWMSVLPNLMKSQSKSQQVILWVSTS